MQEQPQGHKKLELVFFPVSVRFLTSGEGGVPSSKRKRVFAFPFWGGSRPGKRKDRVHLSVSGGGGRHE